MLDFKTTYSCPTRLIAGGGAGKWGLCAMELVNVILGNTIRDDDDTTPRVMDYSPAINNELGAILISLNDFAGDALSDYQRTQAIWPIIPSILDTSHLPFPRHTVKAALGYSEEEDHEPAFWVHDYALQMASANKDDEKASTWFPHVVETTKKVISAFHRYHGTTPMGDYTPEQMDNLNKFLSHYEGSEKLSPILETAA